MNDLTPRQVQILKSVVEEYIETAIPVGSDVLEKKYGIGVSPATIRNEMVALVTGGYLRQPHTSAGRIPTPRAIKFYVNQLMEEKKLSVAEEVAAREQVVSAKDNFDKVMHQVTKALADNTHCLAIAATDKGEVWHAGYAYILDIPEFYNIDVTSKVLTMIEEARRIQELFFEKKTWDEPIEILFGEELGWPNFESVGIVAYQCSTNFGRTSLGVIGPMRFNYSSVIPVVRYFGNLISDSNQSWQQR